MILISFPFLYAITNASTALGDAKEIRNVLADDSE